jgi:hypothetical protein
MKFKVFIYLVLLLEFFVAGLCIGRGTKGLQVLPARRDRLQVKSSIADLNDIPSVEEQIRFLESKGFDCGEPKDKAGPKFCEAINRWDCNRYALPWFE